MALQGCTLLQAASEPSAEQIASANYGTPPDASKVEAAIRAWADDYLKDPSSLQIRRVSDPHKGWVSECVVPGIPPYTSCESRMFYFGHVVKAEINAKNAYGGYTGFKPKAFLMHGNQIVRVADTQ